MNILQWRLLPIAAVLAASLPGLAGAQSGPVQIDESKIPDWVRRQASSPIKVIISSEPTRKPVPAAKPEAPAPRPRPAAVVATPSPSAAPSPVVTAGAPATNAAASASPAVALATMEPVTLTPVVEAPAPEAAPAPLQVAALAPAPAAKPVAAAPSRPPEVQVQSELRLLRRVDPQLPESLLQSLGGPASVEVSFTVETDGSVNNAKVVSSSHTGLSRPTLAAVRAWRFEPLSSARDMRMTLSFGGR